MFMRMVQSLLIVMTANSLASSTAASDNVANNSDWQWQEGAESSRGKLGPQELQDLIDRHQSWLEKLKIGAYEHSEDTLRLVLKGASLRGMTLSHTRLDWAILDSADLRGATLGDCSVANTSFRHANLYGTNLETLSSLDCADFTGAMLKQTTLRGKTATCADFSGADLDAADLSSTDFTGGVFVGTSLVGANLERTNFAQATLSHACYEEIRGLPDIPSISRAHGLNSLTYKDDPASLVT